MDPSVPITGSPLSPEAVMAIARYAAPVQIGASARRRMRSAAEIVRVAAQAGMPVYGLTTGLGSRVLERVDGDDAAAFSLTTLRGRAMAVGEPLPAELTRAAMTVRCNGLCAGGSGAGEGIADGLAALLNAGVHPCVPPAARSARRTCACWRTSA
jgi:histidine ammonia-lyase